MIIAGASAYARVIEFEPFAEVARIRFSPTLTPSGFDPTQFYGSDRIWSLTLGAKLTFGMSHMRMGRYGMATNEKRGMKMSGMHMHGAAASPPTHNESR